MPRCQVCRSDAVNQVLDLGRQPLANRFVRDREAAEYTHPLRLAQCTACGLVQLGHPVPAEELMPRYDWITAFEPELHLDAVADIIVGLPGLTRQSAMCGVSFKDDTLLERLNRRGCPDTRRLHPQEDLDIRDPCALVETVQHALTPERASVIASRYGRFDLIVARHIVEHASDVHRFVEALRELMKPGAYVYLEVPDNESAIAKLDYSIVWEEHTLYFTTETFRRFFSYAGLEPEVFEVFPFELENCLVAIARCVSDTSGTFPESGVLAAERERMRAYGDSFKERSLAWQDFLSTFRKKKGKIALFGAGHLGVAFINYHGVAEWIEFVVDDNPHKAGLCMPGSMIPIVPSRALVENDIGLCLLGVNPQSEQKIIAGNEAFAATGGRFLSIFPGSTRSLRSGEQWLS